MHFRFAPLLLLIAVSSAGCGGGAPADAPKLAPAKGVLKYKGTPVAKAAVTFFPEKGPVGTATTDDQGAFEIKTNGALGAVIGNHKVTAINAPADAEIPPADGRVMEYAKKQKGVLPAKYNSKETTDLKIEIPAAGNEQLTLDAT